MIHLAAFALAACLAVGAGSDQVLAGDLAAAFPEWRAVPPETPLALAPAPGVQRVFRLPELRRLLVARGYQEAITYSFIDPKLSDARTVRQKDPHLARL